MPLRSPIVGRVCRQSYKQIQDSSNIVKPELEDSDATSSIDWDDVE
jgi:hypothetical protein